MVSIKLGALGMNAAAGYTPRMLVLAGPEETFGFNEKPFLRSVIFQCEKLPKGMDQESFAEKQNGLLTKHMQGFKKVRNHRVTIHGVDCPMIEATNVGPGGIMLTNLICYFVHGDMAITLSAAHLTGPRFEKVRKEFVSIFETLTVLEPAAKKVAA